jgi:agmatinase
MYETAPPFNFLGLPPENSDRAHSRALVLPVPYEATTSYGSGTKDGPRAIVEASRQVELYDLELGFEPAIEWGIHTLPALSPDLSSTEAAIGGIAEAVEALSKEAVDNPNGRQLLVALGGEHSISGGIARGLKAVHGDYVTVQLDAHADLRESYEGTIYSHACAARRILEHSSEVIQLGIRSVDVGEAEYYRDHPDRVHVTFAHQMQNGDGYLAELADRIRGRKVYLTIDIDALDQSVMPATGTPEPGGLTWYQMLSIIRTVANSSDVIAFDCVELAPIPSLRASDFTTAKLVYKTINYILSSPAWSIR